MITEHSKNSETQVDSIPDYEMPFGEIQQFITHEDERRNILMVQDMFSEHFFP